MGDTIVDLDMHLGSIRLDIEKLNSMLDLLTNDYFHKYTPSTPDGKQAITSDFPFNAVYADISLDYALKIADDIAAASSILQAMFEAKKLEQMNNAAHPNT